MQLATLTDHIAIDVKGALARFSGAEALYLKYLKRFAAEDKSFETFCQALAGQELKAVEESAHALKGICGNLGLTELYELYSEVVNAARAADPVKAYELGRTARERTEYTHGILRQLD